MFRMTLFASLLALGATATGAQAFDHGARLGDAGRGLAAPGGPPSGNVVGGGHAAISGGGHDMDYQAAPDARTQETGGIGRMIGGGEGTRVVYEQAAPPAVRLAENRGR